MNSSLPRNQRVTPRLAVVAAGAALLVLVAVLATFQTVGPTGHAQELAGGDCPAASQSGDSYASFQGNIDIPDNNPDGILSCMSIDAPAATVIKDVRVFVSIAHTYVGDLVVKATHVDTGTTVVLLDRPGYSGNGSGCAEENVYATFWDDFLGIPAEDECSSDGQAIFGVVGPFEPLSAFDGEPIAGMWVLNVSDNNNFYTGQFDQWSMLVTVGEATPTPTPTNTPVNTPTPIPCSAPGLVDTSDDTNWSFGDALAGPLAIPDNNAQGASDCIQITADGSRTITSLLVAVDISHGWVGDLTVKLTNLQTQTTVVLLDRPGFPASGSGCSADDIFASFSDQALSMQTAEDVCNGSPPAIQGIFLPVESLDNAFAGGPIAGAWQITVSDNSSTDTGTLNAWSLHPVMNSVSTPTATNTPGGPTNTPTNTPAGPTNTPTNTPAGPTTTPTNTPVAPTSTPTTPAAIPGDVNCDGNVTAVDAALVLQFTAGLLPSLACPQAADLNNDGSVNAIDAAIILQISAGLL